MNNDFGKILVDECQRIDMNSLVRRAKQLVRETLLENTPTINGVEVKIVTTKVGNGGYRYWFECPECGKRCSSLFRHPLTQTLGCRECLGLKYRKCAKKGMIEEY